MLSSKKRTPALVDLQRLFGRSLSGSPIPKMAEPRASSPCTPVREADFAASEGSRSPVLYTGSPAASTSNQGPLPCLQGTYGVDEELKAILRALPMRADIEALVGRLEAAHKKEISEVKKDVETLSACLTSGESS